MTGPADYTFPSRIKDWELAGLREWRRFAANEKPSFRQRGVGGIRPVAPSRRPAAYNTAPHAVQNAAPGCTPAPQWGHWPAAPPPP